MVEVFADQMDGWLLRHSEFLCSADYPGNPHGRFAALAIATSYFETIEAYCRGESSENRSKEFFRGGFLRVFPGLADRLAANGYAPAGDIAGAIADEVYRQLRCGLFHEGLPKFRVMLRDDTEALGFMIERTTNHIGCVVVDSRRFVEAIRQHLDHFINQLRDPANGEQRERFTRHFVARRGAEPIVEPPAVGGGAQGAG